jgi:hypothetical protein
MEFLGEIPPIFLAFLLLTAYRIWANEEPRTTEHDVLFAVVSVVLWFVTFFFASQMISTLIPIPELSTYALYFVTAFVPDVIYLAITY